MIFLWILGTLVFIVLAILFLPVKVSFKFNEEFFIKVYFLGIKIYEPKTKEEKPNQKKKSQNNAIKEKPKTLFLRLKEKYGFSGAVREIFGFLKDTVTHIKVFLRHIKIEKLKLFISVSSDDAAKTALDYGRVCAVAYPFLSALDSMANIEYKKIDIKSDFEATESNFSIEFNVKLRIFYLLITLFKVYNEYTKFTARIEADERK